MCFIPILMWPDHLCRMAPRCTHTKNKAQVNAKKSRSTIETYLKAVAEAKQSWEAKEGPRSVTSIAAQIGMSARTLVHAINGGQSIQDFNTSKAWLSPAEKDTVIMWIRAWSAMDFPPTWKLVTEAANMIIQEKYSDVTLHVSDQWISHFIYANYLDLSTKWAWSHDKTCANTLNPTNVIKAMEVETHSDHL